VIPTMSEDFIQRSSFGSGYFEDFDKEVCGWERRKRGEIG